MLNLLSFASVMQTVWYVVLALLILLLMITVHELGHYIAGKIFKFKINEFAIGFGPALFKKTKKNGEVFSVRALPLGGYCAFEGEDEENPDPNAFNNKKPWQRIIVLAAGATMNFITAILLIFILFFAYGQPLLYVGNTAVSENSYYNEYSLKQGDVIIKLEGKNVYQITDIMSTLKNKKEGDELNFYVDRRTENGRVKMPVTVVLRATPEIGALDKPEAVYEALGLAEDDTGNTMYQTLYNKFGFFDMMGRVFAYAMSLAGTIFTVLGQLLTGKLGLSAMGGPVSTIAITSQMMAGGFHMFLYMAAFIGVNLAVFNLLPIPALDGSKIVFTTIEWIRGKPINRKVEAVIHVAGLLFLLGFAVLVDLLKLF